MPISLHQLQRKQWSYRVKHSGEIALKNLQGNFERKSLVLLVRMQESQRSNEEEGRERIASRQIVKIL